MLGKGLRLYKREKLCSVTAIDRLFAARVPKDSLADDGRGPVGTALAYPIRMVFGQNRTRSGAPVQFLISVPKKKLRHAVDRVLMRRRIREAYRLGRGPVQAVVDTPDTPRLDVAFIYVADCIVDSARVRKAMSRLLAILDDVSSRLQQPGDQSDR